MEKDKYSTKNNSNALHSFFDSFVIGVPATVRITQVKQPYGGYLPVSSFKKTELTDGIILFERENISPILVGLVVDYLSRFMNGRSPLNAFSISLRGSTYADQYFPGAYAQAESMVSKIKGLDNTSIIYACKLSTFDVWYRNPSQAPTDRLPSDFLMPDKDTIENIRTMVNRAIKFFSTYGPVVKDGFDFKPNGYTMTVTAGDGDFLTSDTLWDFKVSKNKPNSKYTLQLIMYWIMGQHSGQEIFKSITKIGIFNPRRNEMYTLDVKDIDEDIIKEIENDVICY